MTTIIILAALATAASLALGLRSMAHGGDDDRADSGKYMTVRVGLQGLTLVLLLIALLLH